MSGGDVRGQSQPCRCPYCDAVYRESLPICQLCGAAIMRCPQCGMALTQNETRCPGCGAKLGEGEREPDRDL
ncbi:MAG: zinc-ribbon domain-containing protein [Anaerolineae bacterium]|nr:zinc-ribbon domain-containing protein [Anaerolineae bacterium]